MTNATGTDFDAEFLERHPVGIFFAELRRKRLRRVLGRTAVIGSAAAACMAVMIVAGTYDRRADLRMKGTDIQLFAYRKTAEGIALVNSADVLGPGTEIQIAYRAGGGGFGAILSVDGRGILTRHMPLHGDAALVLGEDGFQLLPYSYRLDDAPLFEDIYLIVSSRSFKVDDLEPFLRAGYGNRSTRLQMPDSFRWATVRVRKTEETE